MRRGTQRARPGSAGVGDLGPTVHAVHRGVLRKEGEYWTLGSAGRFFRLKDTRGLGHIAHLLRHPGTEFHVLDLAVESRATVRMTKPAGLRVCLAGIRISKRQASISAVWVMRARSSTSKRRSRTDAGFPICAKSWKKPRNREMSSAQSRRNRRSMH
jgi:hypothetical protein